MIAPVKPSQYNKSLKVVFKLPYLYNFHCVISDYLKHNTLTAIFITILYNSYIIVNLQAKQNG